MQQATDLSVRENWELGELEEKWDPQKPEEYCTKSRASSRIRMDFRGTKSAKMSKIRLVVNRKQQVSGESSQVSRWQRVEIKMPPGLSPRELRLSK